MKAPVKTGGTLHDALIAANKEEETTESVLAERGKIHGEFSQDASFSQELKATLRSGPNWETMSSVQHEALEMIATKLGRITVGDPRHKDHWLDIAGYAMLVAQRL